MFNPDWQMTSSKELIEAEIGPIKAGWTETSTDTVYCKQVSNDLWKIYVWNTPNIRETLLAILKG